MFANIRTKMDAQKFNAVFYDWKFCSIGFLGFDEWCVCIARQYFKLIRL
jgi:hypothetical protein